MRFVRYVQTRLRAIVRRKNCSIRNLEATWRKPSQKKNETPACARLGESGIEREESGNDVQRRSVIDDHIAEMIRQEGSDCMLTAGNYKRCDVFSPWMHEQNFISCWLQFLSQSTPTQSVRRTAALQAPPRDTPSAGRGHPA